jgi:citrate lyase subunit beta/citryl-CoA lyase
VTVSPWRSLLYVPAHQPRFVAKAHERGADAVVLDLEDGVPEVAKDAARAALAEAVPSVARAGASAWVRIDARWRRAWRDAEAAVAAGAEGLMLPKVADAGTVRVFGDFLTELERAAGAPEGRTRLIALIEDARGLQVAREVAAHPRVAALVPGNEDLALDLGVAPEPDVLAPLVAPLLLAARAEGKWLLGTLGTGAGFTDLEAYRAAVERSRRFGFQGATCIHPAQVAIIHAVYAATEADLDHARRVVAAFDAAGGGAVAVDGAMVDRPVAERARALLARADAGGDA